MQNLAACCRSGKIRRRPQKDSWYMQGSCFAPYMARISGRIQMKKYSRAISMAISFAFAWEAGFAIAQTDAQTASPTVSDSTVSGKNLPHDPKVNPDYPFKSRYRSTGPVRIYFSYQAPDVKFDQKLNQLTVVTKERLTGANVVAGLVAATGSFSSNMFSTRDSLVGYQITDIVHREKLENPALNDIPALLDKKISEHIKNTPSLQNRKFFEKLTVLPAQWALVFDDSAAHGTDLRYVLKFRASVVKAIEGDEASLLHAPETRAGKCEFVSEPETLDQWRADDYASVAALRPKIVDSCMRQIAEALPRILQEGEKPMVVPVESLIKKASVMCKTEYRQCVGVAKQQGPDIEDAIQDCQEDYKQCQVDEIVPLKQATPIGQCKKAMNACKIQTTERLQSASPDARPTRSDFAGCVDEYKVCVAAAKEGKGGGDSEDGKSTEDADNASRD
jgi:hypothetical protein